MDTKHSPESLLDAFLMCIVHNIIPRTTVGVAEGSKVFGAAILDKSDLSLVISETNNEKACPLYHGEVHTIKCFYEMPPDRRPLPKDCIFLSTHEPCSLCLSAITWSGFDNFYYLFTYEDTRDAFSIPHDIEILQEVFQTSADGESHEARGRRPLYNRSNKFFYAVSLADVLARIGDARDREMYALRIAEVKRTYAQLSDGYQKRKGQENAIAFQ